MASTPINSHGPARSVLSSLKTPLLRNDVELVKVSAKVTEIATLNAKVKELSETENRRKLCFCVTSSICHPITCIPFTLCCFGPIYLLAGLQEDHNPSSPVYEENTYMRAICPIDLFDCRVLTLGCTCCPDTDFLAPPERQEMSDTIQKIRDISHSPRYQSMD